ncbi:hypothetical protein AWB67_06567 [Caballeronia terrestris]|uniref:Lipoprotein n=1 Tax=Caballeronia terrestris TaxID=1226301 RepID=A0A158KSB5_9BURK|nr:MULTISPECIES: hypothetical protein [Caballeronia]SAL06082.1 hypothetical protein AWB81_07435 [Caballeronia arationis]SAL84007.1 hypothetical protein AWB67_06567 [Caballeronia terrestris]
MKRLERPVFLFLLLVAIGCAVAAVDAWYVGNASQGRWASTAGLVTALAGVVQLEISGLFTKVIDHYSDETKYPYGPPSYITRQIIDNPDTPIRTQVGNVLFFNMRTGFWLIVCGTVLQIIGSWLA